VFFVIVNIFYLATRHYSSTVTVNLRYPPSISFRMRSSHLIPGSCSFDWSFGQATPYKFIARDHRTTSER